MQAKADWAKWCNLCANILSNEFPKIATGTPDERKAFEDILATDKATQDDWMRRFDLLSNGRRAKTKRDGSSSAGGTDDINDIEEFQHPDDPTESGFEVAVAKDVDTFEHRWEVGIFWPKKLYDSL